MQSDSMQRGQKRAPFVEAKQLTLSFGQTPALRGASLSVHQGEIVAVMGPSGSGKSTLLYCLAGILVPDSGEVWFDGRRVDTMTEAERSMLRREQFGFVFQFGQLIPELSAEENVALPLLIGGVGVPMRLLRRAVLLEAVVPLLLTASVSIAAGLVASELYLRSELSLTLRPPGLSYYVVVLTGLAASIGVVGLSLPVIGRIAGPEVARNG